MSQKISLAELLSFGTHQGKEWDWNWYIMFVTWLFKANGKTTLDQKIDDLNNLLEKDPPFREVFVQQWLIFIENVQFDSLLVHTFSGESDSFVHEVVWAFCQKFITVPASDCEISHLVDEALQLNFHFDESLKVDSTRLNKLFSYFPPDKITYLTAEIKQSLVRAIFILANKNMSDIYSSFFKMTSSDKFNSDFVKTLQVISLTEISDPESLIQLTSNNMKAIDSIVDDFRETGVRLNSLFRIKKIKSRLIRIQNLIKLYEGFSFKYLVAILIERKNFYSLKFQFFHYSSQLIEVVSLTSAEKGDHYVGRSRQAITKLFTSACGGGFITGFTVLLKTLSSYLHLAPFLLGFIYSLNYALSFIVIYLLGFTLATKQPAAIAAHLNYQWAKLSRKEILAEIDSIFKSQFLAVLGNVGIVIPTVLLISFLSEAVFSQSFMSVEKAQAQIASMSIFSFTPFYAFLTGYILWFSTFVTGAADNFFKVYKFGEIIMNSPKIFPFLPHTKKAVWVNFIKNNFGPLCGNAALGFILGIVPIMGEFLGLPIDVRHVTLSSGTIAAAIYTLGFGIFSEPAAYMALLGVVVTGLLNLSISFVISLRVAESSNALSEKNLDPNYSKNLLIWYFRKKLHLQ